MPSTSSPSWAEEIRSRYGSGADFLKLFNPGRQSVYCLHAARCFTGSAPVLSRLRVAYGDALAESWLEVQLYDLAEFAGCQTKQTTEQRTETARVILCNFYFLKVTEIMYFFQLFKSGCFGRFYGVVDGMVIMDALRRFLPVRIEEITKAERAERQEERQRELEKRERESMTRQEYEEWKLKQAVTA